MSEYENHSGTLLKLVGDPDELAKDILIQKGEYASLNKGRSYSKWLVSEHEEYVLHKGVLYQVTVDRQSGDDDLFMAQFNPLGLIDYQLRFYNGGCGFQEAIQYALDKLYAEQ